MSKKDKTGKEALNPKQRLFCEYYVSEDSFGHGTESYMKAYDKDSKKKKDYETSKVNASVLLTNTNICHYITDLIDLAGFNEQFMDKQLLLLATQNEDRKTKLGALREFNNLKGRIIKKLDHSSKGEKITSVNIQITKSDEKK